MFARVLPFKRQPHKMVEHTQTIRRLLQTNCLNVFDLLWGWHLKGEIRFCFWKDWIRFWLKIILTDIIYCDQSGQHVSCYNWTKWSTCVNAWRSVSFYLQVQEIRRHAQNPSLYIYFHIECIYIILMMERKIFEFLGCMKYFKTWYAFYQLTKAF